MPTESQHNAIHRQWEMLKLLPSREPGMTTLEIRQSLSDLGYDVDNRTIQRNLEKLQSLFPINHGDENPYRWYWESKHAFETLGITVTDALTLHLLKRILKPILPVATTRQLEPLFEMAESKLAALADSNEIAQWASLIAVEGSGLPVIPPEINSTILETVQNALLKGESLKIHYAKAGVDGYRMVEVKSSTTVKPYHLDDTAIQYWVARQSGVPITSIKVACIDTTFVYQGDGNYAGLLKQVDVSVTASKLESEIPGWIHAARQTLAGDKPTIDVGKQCQKPYGCPFLDACTAESQRPKAHYPVEMLPYVGKLADELRSEGIEDVRDIPPNRLDLYTHERIRRVSISGQAELDSEATESMRRLGYPRHFIDFETINPAVPLWRGTRPYEHVPFQWSCHTEEKDGSVTHHEFLASGTDDPRRAFAESLAAALSRIGPVFVYNAGTERTHMQNMAERFPDLAPVLNEAIEWIVDLLPMTRQCYYHPDMMGSYSIKDVLPTFAPELAYDNLEVGSGKQAMQIFAELMNPNLPNIRRTSLRESLLSYCERDTLAMVKLTHFFRKGPRK